MGIQHQVLNFHPALGALNFYDIGNLPEEPLQGFTIKD
jgi:hypothetical protein